MLKIPKYLLDTLHELRAKQLNDSKRHPTLHLGDYFRSTPAVLLWGDLPGSIYLVFDGRVMLEVPLGEVEELNDVQLVAMALVSCASDEEIPELMELVPARPEDGVVCEGCKGTRVRPRCYPSVCRDCLGLGWQHPLAPPLPGAIQ